jgi:P-type Cu+ transporter
MHDPVCGKTLAPENVQATTTYLDCPYRFCSAVCKQKFEANPRLYLSDSALGS